MTRPRAVPMPPRAVLGASLVVALGACAPRAQGPSTEPPHATQDIRPAVVALSANNFEDTDGNRYRDSANVTVFIFSDSPRHPVAMEMLGEFDLTLTDATGTLLARWHFTAEQAERARGRFGPGPGFLFVLSLNDRGTDKMETHEAQLSCVFTPPDGPPIQARSKASVLVGPAAQGRP